MHIVCTHRFLFRVSDSSIVYKQFKTSSICLEGSREDAWSSGDAESSWGEEGVLDVDMGEAKKKGLGIAQLWNSYICAY
jgi:hypothetical protein